MSTPPLPPSTLQPIPGKRTGASESRCRIKSSHGTTGICARSNFLEEKNWAHICARPTLFSSPLGNSRSENCCQFPHLATIKTDAAIAVTVCMMPIKMELHDCLFALLLENISKRENADIFIYVTVLEHRYNLHLSRFILLCSAFQI